MSETQSINLTFPMLAGWSPDTLNEHLKTLAVDGVTGWSFLDDIEVHLGRDLDEDAVAIAEQAIADHLAAYIHVPTWDAVRAERVRWFERLDAEVAKASRQLRMAERDNDGTAAADAVAYLAALDDYGQALADLTEGPDPENPEWPTKPW